MKKILSVALALIMGISCCTVMASALQTRAAVEITVKPTEASYQKGDTVTFEVLYEGSEEEFLLGSPTIIGFGYDSSVFETVEDLTSNKDGNSQNTYILDGYPIAEDYTPAMSSVRVLDGANEADAAKGWDKILHIAIPSFSLWDFSEQKAAFAFKLKVKEDANPDGCYLVGISGKYHDQEFINLNDEYGGVFGSDVEGFGFSYPSIFSFVDAKVEVPTTAASILQWSKAQIRFKGIAQDGAKADYQGTFDVRTVAKISEADFIAKFGSNEAAKRAITDLGFVYMINGDFDYATAVEVANGASAAGYTKKSVSYIQHAGAGEDYIFTCLIADNPDTAKNDTLTCIAFVKTADETIVFDAPSTVNYSELYGLMPA